MNETTTSLQTFYPALRYTDARAAIAWLVKTFGFEEAVCYPSEDGSVAHAELRFHDGMVMLGSARDDGYPIKPPAQLGGLSASIYVAVPAAEIDAHYARTKAASRLRFTTPITDRATTRRSISKATSGPSAPTGRSRCTTVATAGVRRAGSIYDLGVATNSPRLDRF
jgi:uncharacterized glyoxalase superfamily protein PhnB